MNLLIIGSGGREHALAWKLKQSPKAKNIFIAPGNAGTSLIGKNVPMDISNHQAIIDFSRNNKIDLVVIGPDDVLASGLADSLANAGINAFGPTKAASQIEWSKSFAKKIMKHLNIPTARFEEFSDIESAKEYIKTQKYPLVIKADGLALGKGVVMANSKEEADNALNEIMLNKSFGEAGNTVVIEEYLEGEEISIHAFSDGENIAMFPGSQDHKRIFDNDKGPNTGGMGTVAPYPAVTSEILRDIEQSIVIPLIRELKKQGREFKGVLYPGIMLTEDGPKVLEFNARFGDPETQSYMRILKTDLLEILLASVNGKLKDIKIEWEENLSACTVILASQGYPNKYPKEFPIKGIQDAEKNSDIVVFHAGTKTLAGNTVTNGGRVLGISATGADLSEACKKAYKTVGMIKFEGMQYRTDIG